MNSAELYFDAKPDGHGGVTLALRRPIQTTDAASYRMRGDSFPLFAPDQSTRFPTAGERGLVTRDDVLTGPEPQTRISLGKVWTGDDGDPLVTAANYYTQVLGEGCFAADRPLNAESLSDVISLGKMWLGQLEAVQASLVADGARGRGSKDDACDNPKEHEAGPMLSRDSAPTKSRM